MDIAQNIKKRRLELGISQQELAEALGYQSRSSIAKIESGSTDVPISKLVNLARALDVSIENLLTGAASKPRGNGRLYRPGGKGERQVGAIVLAGGKSRRNKQNIPNQFVEVLGKPIMAYCLEVYERHPLVDEVFIVCPDGWEEIVLAYARQFEMHKVRAALPAGKSGVLSIREGVRALQRAGYEESDLIVLQEATRPFVNEEMVSAVLMEAARTGGAITGEAMGDSVQFILNDGKTSYIDRDKVVSLQSPDAYTLGFLCELFAEATKNGLELSDTCIGLLMNRMGHSLNFCETGRGNMKIVRAEDIAVFGALAKYLR